MLVPKCSCIALGKLCRDKCHGKEGHKVKCSNCVTEHHQSHNYPTRKKKNNDSEEGPQRMIRDI